MVTSSICNVRIKSCFSNFNKIAGVSQRQLCERLESKTVATPVIRDLQEGVVF